MEIYLIGYVFLRGVYFAVYIIYGFIHTNFKTIPVDKAQITKPKQQIISILEKHNGMYFQYEMVLQNKASSMERD